MRVERLLGRARELASLDRSIAALDAGQTPAIAVVGEPGIGKSRLLTELAMRADARRFLVLSGSASELERELPFWIFVEALDEYLQALEPARFEGLDERIRRELSHIFPALARFAVVGEVAFPDERYRTHRAVCSLLEWLAATTPLVLILDDIHWADPASVELVGGLLRRPPAAPVLLALAMRPRQAPERLTAAVERAHRGGSLTRLEVGGLSYDETCEFLGEAFRGPAATALFDDSGGNPFYLEQLAHSLAGEGAAGGREQPLTGLGVPPAVAAALADEIGVLSARARLVLQGAAVAGDPFEPELAAAAAAVPETVALEALDELLERDLIRETDVPRRFRFRHPLVRRAVYEGARGGWRLAAHQRCASALEARGASAADRAHHVQRCGRKGDAADVATLRNAAEWASQRAPASAAVWFGDALRLLADDASVELRVGMTLSRARSLIATGQFPEGHAALLDSIDLVSTAAPALRVRLTSACAGVERLLGRHEQAHTRLVEAVAELTDESSAEAAALAIDLAMDAFARMDYPRMRDNAEGALSIARLLGDRPLFAAASSVLAFALAAGGATVQAQAAVVDATTLVAALDDGELGIRLDAAANLAGAELYLDHYPAAEHHAQRALSVARTTAQSEFIPLADSILGQVKLLTGQLNEAGLLLDNAVECARLSGNVQALAGNLVNRSLTALAAGNLDIALCTAEENAELTQGLDQSLVCAAGFALASVLLEHDDRQRSVDVLLTSSGGHELPLIPGVWRTRALELLTRCWLKLGHFSEAERAATAAQGTAEALHLGMADALAGRAAAAIALAHGDPDDAATLATASAIAADQIGSPVEAGLARLLAGRALSQAGQREPAVAQFKLAAAQLHACGAVRYRAATEFELRRLGHRTHRRTDPGTNSAVGGVASLTQRELEVAHLVVDRRTNSQIAETLFLSQKTVETHIRNIFRKLHVTSRAELARSVERNSPRRNR